NILPVLPEEEAYLALFHGARRVAADCDGEAPRRERAAALLPTVVGQMVAARGAEESTAWRQPVDLVALCEESTSELADLFAAGRGSRDWSGHAALAQELLGDDPARIVDALKEPIRPDAAPAD